MDADELAGAEESKGEVHCRGRAGEREGAKGIRRIEGECRVQRVQGRSSPCVELIRQEWQRTGYVWEQYDAETGEGRRR